MWRRIEAWLDASGGLTRGGDGGLVFDGDRVKAPAPEPKPGPAAAPAAGS
jgi:hypothetical protein